MSATSADDRPLIAAVYCRISRDDDGDMLGVRRQEKDGRALCARKGWPVGEVFTDDDVSAWSGRVRPAYRAMLKAIEVGDVTAVVAYDLDRLHRLPRELEEFFDVCDRAGVTQMATVAGDVDLGNDNGRLHARIMGAVAKKSSDDTSRRLKRMNDDRAAEGKPHGARAFGYEADGVTVDEEQAELLRQAARDVLLGESLNSIARRWNAMGVLTPQRQKPWNGTVVRSVLTNPRQAGLRVHRGVVVGPGAWPAIIDRGTHDRLVATFDDPDRRRRTPARRQEWTGFIRCGICGQPMDRDTVKGRSMYRCHKRPGRDNCGRMTIAAESLEAILVESVLQVVDTPKVARRVARGRRAVEGREAELSGELVAIERRRTELAEMYGAEEIGKAEWMTVRAHLEKRERATKSALSKLAGTEALDEFSGEVGSLRAAWPGLSIDRRRSVIGALVDRVVIQPATRRGPVFDVGRVDVRWRV